MTTKADEKIESAKSLLSQAYKELLVVLDEDTWGHNDLKEDYINTVHEVAVQLLNLKRKL